MQVTHVHDHVTHAVIGGAKTIDFGISNSAEFFNILSSTLYKDQILAVVREVLCNAWDAHIDAACTDRPIKVTLDNDKLVIQDMGKGIPADDIGSVYGTYGNSTKKNDGKQTGGFGLGCKAPFAYTDHFEVISSHGGVKTIYAMSKSSAQAQGKPGITPLASLPTTETGLTVTIRIKTSDRHRFHSLIKTIAANGDMNVELNGALINTLNFDTSKNNYLIYRDTDLVDSNSRIYVRYGNVIYPVDRAESNRVLYERVIEHLNTLTPRHYSHQSSFNILFQAVPHSIAVTPSRESLSMQEHTVKSLNKLFEAFLDGLKTLPAEIHKQADVVVEEAAKKGKLDTMLTRDHRLPMPEHQDRIDRIQDLILMARQTLSINYPRNSGFRNEDITRRLKYLVQYGFLNRGLVQTFLRELESADESNRTTWLQRRVIKPMIMKLVNAGLDHKNLFVCDRRDSSIDAYSKEPYLTSAVKACPEHLHHALPYLRNLVVLTSSRMTMVNRLTPHPIYQELGSYDGYLVYQTRKQAEIEKARTLFTSLGVKFIDLTVRQDWETEVVAPRVVVRKPVKQGLPIFKSIMAGKEVDLSWSRDEEAERILEPEFVISFPVREKLSKNELPTWDRSTTKALIELYGDKGGIAVTSTQHDNWTKKGAKPFDEYTIEDITRYISSSPTIAEYWAFNPDRLMEDFDYYSSNKRDALTLIYSNQVLRSNLNLINNLTEEDKKYLCLYKYALGNYHHTHHKAMSVLKTSLDKIPLDPANQAVLDQITASPLFSIMSIDGMTRFLRNPNTSQAQIDKTIQILFEVLKG